MNNSKDILAKLLSTEDVQVVRASVPTASFDVKNRVLTLPTFVNLEETVENLMIGHEVGHALWTDPNYATEEVMKDKLTKNYANVIEDVRIEKLIQAEYPGLRTDFLQGYKKLADDDFFQIKGKDVNSLHLIDKINLYFKIGLKSGIKFSDEEFKIVSRVDSCKTFPQVIELAKELAEYARKKKKEEEEALQEQMAQAGDLNDADLDEEYETKENDDDTEYDESDSESNSEEVETEEGDDDNGDSFSSGLEGGSGQADQTPEYSDTSLESQTQASLDTKMTEHAKYDGKIFRNVQMEEYPMGVDPKISYKKILKQIKTPGADGYKSDNESVHSEIMNDSKVIKDNGSSVYLDSGWHAGDTETFKDYYGREYLGDKSGAYYKEDYDNFMNNIKSDIDYMVKEFEMKKSAQRYARTETAKTGQLDVKKLYNYKLSEDLFKRINVVSDDKNHGFVMLVDWSGSMQNIMRDTMRQVIILSTFCRKVNIPFEVLAFSNHDNVHNRYSNDNENSVELVSQEDYEKVVAAKSANNEKLHHIRRENMWLYQLLTNEMNNKEFDEMCFYLHSFLWYYSYNLSLSGTPLTEALEIMVGYTSRFQKQHNLDKLNFITLTDGAGYSRGIQSNYQLERELYPDINGRPLRGSYVDTLIDPVTKKKYVVSGSRNNFDFAFLDAIKSRGCTTIGYFLGRNSFRGMQQFYHYNHPSYDGNGEYPMFGFDKARLEIRKNGGWGSFSDFGRDEMFFLDTAKLNPASVDATDIDNIEKKTASQIARQFTKGLKTNRQSKVLMNTFVDRVA